MPCRTIITRILLPPPPPPPPPHTRTHSHSQPLAIKAMHTTTSYLTQELHSQFERLSKNMLLSTSIALLFLAHSGIAQQQDSLPVQLPQVDIEGRNYGTCPSAEVTEQARNSTKRKFALSCVTQCTTKNSWFPPYETRWRHTFPVRFLTFPILGNEWVSLFSILFYTRGYTFSWL